MKNKSYVGGWSVNNSTDSYGYTDTNKRRLAKDLREMANGNVFAGNSGRWYVYAVIDGEVSEEPILTGRV